MLRSALFAPFRRGQKDDDSSASGRYLTRMGYIAPMGAGLINHLPLGFALFNNVKSVLNGHLEQSVPCSFFEAVGVQPARAWEDAGRLSLFGAGIFRFPDRHGRELVLAPTHEVTAAAIAARYIRSYRDLPIRISQIQVKFRDEERPRAGVIRTRQFQMHDLYAFDRDLDAAQTTYAMVRDAYMKTFFDLRLPIIPRSQSDMGAIGGDRSEEFLMPCAIGDDRWTSVDGQEHNCLELAHIFQLGDGYSIAAGAKYSDSKGAEHPVYMSSFGLGIERAAAAYIEKYLRPGEDVELHWSWAMSPFQVSLLSDGVTMRDLYRRLRGQGLRVLLDDRDLPMRHRFGEGRRMGFPIEVLQGARHRPQEVELCCDRTGQKLTVDIDEVDDALTEMRQRLEAVEIAERFGEVVNLDAEARNLVVAFSDPWKLEHSALEVRQVPSDLIGCFGARKRWGTPRPYAGDYSVVAVAAANVSRPEWRDGTVPYVAWPSDHSLDLGELRSIDP